MNSMAEEITYEFQDIQGGGLSKAGARGQVGEEGHTNKPGMVARPGKINAQPPNSTGEIEVAIPMNSSQSQRSPENSEE